MNLHDLPPRPGCRAIVVGGGPTAPDSYDWIKAQDAVVVAASTMLLPLQSTGVSPELTCVIDPSALMPLHFRLADTSRSLIYLPSVVERIYREWAGLKYRVWDLPGSSVLHLCVDVALRLGAVEVTLVGADFSYGQGRKSHAPGVITSYTVTERNSVKTVDSMGRQVWSECSLLEYRDELAKMVAARPDVRWLKRGREGLDVPGVEWMDD